MKRDWIRVGSLVFHFGRTLLSDGTRPWKIVRKDFSARQIIWRFYWIYR